MRSLLYTVILFAITHAVTPVSAGSCVDEAQQLMQSDPTEALSRLNGVDVSEFQDSATNGTVGTAVQ